MARRPEEIVIGELDTCEKEIGLGFGERRGACLTQKNVGAAALGWETVPPSRGVLAVRVSEDSNEKEVIDVNESSSKSLREAENETFPASAPGDGPHGNIEKNDMALGGVLTTVAQVRAALGQLSKVGLDEDTVWWGRCSRCGRLGRIVHFEGVFRARGQSP